jgi:hypothetical protein
LGEATRAHGIGHALTLFVGGLALPHPDIRAALPRVFPALADCDGGPLALSGARHRRHIVTLADPRATRWPKGATRNRKFRLPCDVTPAERIDPPARP